MKYHISLKFIAVLLCTCCLVCAISSVAGIAALEVNNLYENSVEDMISEQLEYYYERTAKDILVRYHSVTLGGCPENVVESYYGGKSADHFFYPGTVFYSILDENGELLESIALSAFPGGTVYKTNGVRNYDYLRLLGEPEINHDLDHLDSTMPVVSPTEGEWINDASTEMTAPVTDSVRYDIYSFYDSELGQYVDYRLAWETAPRHTVTLYIAPDALLNGMVFDMLRLFWQNRYNLFWILAGSLLLFAVFAVYLCCAAGKKSGREELKPGGFNCIPLDVYVLILLGALLVSYELIEEGTRVLNGNFPLVIMYLGTILFADCLLFVAFCFACAAQFKMPKLYWLRHMLVGIFALSVWKIVKWSFGILKKIWCCLKEKVPVTAKKIGNCLISCVKWTGSVLYVFVSKSIEVVKRILSTSVRQIVKILKWTGAAVHRFFSLLPLTWQWLLTGFLMTMLLYISLRSYKTGWILVGFGIFFGIILYGAHAFGILMESARNMGKGDLETKVSEQFLVGAFREFAGHLNALADVAKVAAQKQLKSERMKTELITNVSHDIKTPLTSIINYVDLLEKPHTPEEEREYLEVLGRKSQQLKKLIGDLVEMSKASSGSVAVNMEQVDAVEAVNQALGEFADKLDDCGLVPVFSQPTEPVYVYADGRLMWRVLSNLLSNVVKYAMPQTRLYIDLTRSGDRVLISLKNISKEPLNVGADELMERFVRGDASRNTEGSGLGLNIAKSLMEVQNGQLNLTVDGDLFKATMNLSSF